MDELKEIKKPINLNNESLVLLPPDIKVPNYDRSKLTAGIVHVGIGNFHRAHQAWYLQQLMLLGQAQDWAICGASVRSQDKKLQASLTKQDFLTTLIELNPNGYSAEVIGSIIDYIPIEANNSSLIKQLIRPEIRIVSTTITESGYFIDPVTKEFNSQHPEIIHDAKNPNSPITVFGAIISALNTRRRQEYGPITGLSCDNLINNGTIFKNTLISLAQMTNADLADWIEKNCTFPNSMVDCIVPITGQRELELAEEFGVSDNAAVTHENFRQWVIEDKFCNGRPDLEKVGVSFTNNVHSYETMKLRILNGGHQIIATPGELLSLNTVSQCMNNSLIRNYFRKVANEDIVPLVKAVGEIEPTEYVKIVEQRFANPEIVDTVHRVTCDGSTRHSGFLIPIIQDAVSSNTSLDGLALTEALWARMCTEIREDGSEFELVDQNSKKLIEIANKAKIEPMLWLQQRDIYSDLIEDKRFADRFVFWYKEIYSNGVETAISKYLDC